jgi:cytoskeletal protein CcmA (bactofilin family)
MLRKYMQSESPSAPLPRAPAPEAARNDAQRNPAQAIAPGSTSAPAEPMKAIASDEGNKLIVGPNIKLQGAEITNCDILVVEGRVEAAMNSKQIRIAEGGVFVGKAEIDVAEIGGLFDGELTVRDHLVIRATGQVKGTIRYGTITIEQGGVIVGDVGVLNTSPARAHSVPAEEILSPVREPKHEEITPESIGIVRKTSGSKTSGSGLAF